MYIDLIAIPEGKWFVGFGFFYHFCWYFEFLLSQLIYAQGVLGLSEGDLNSSFCESAGLL